ncbi:CD5 antigen-like, partial [Gastrophryne carolinensis]
SAEPLKIRLVDGPHSCSGRLEVHHDGEWSSMCSRKWGALNTKVLCRELKCGSPVRGISCQSLKKGEGKIWQMEVHCSGNEEALSKCNMKPVQGRPCHYREDIWIRCREPFQLRLVNGPSRCVGRLEIYRDGKWGSVCDDLWDDKDANVTCKQLKCDSCQPYVRGRKRFGQSDGKIWLDDVECTGDEESLEKCKHRVWGYHDCSHAEDVSIYCSGQSVKKLN